MRSIALRATCSRRTECDLAVGMSEAHVCKTRRWVTECRDNAVRLALFVLASNLANFLRRLVLPKEMARRSLTSLREKLAKIGARLIRHGRRPR